MKEMLEGIHCPAILQLTDGFTKALQLLRFVFLKKSTKISICLELWESVIIILDHRN